MPVPFKKLPADWQAYIADQSADIVHLKEAKDELTIALGCTAALLFALLGYLLYGYVRRMRGAPRKHPRSTAAVVDEAITQPGAVALVKMLNNILAKTGSVAWKSDPTQGVATFGGRHVLISSAIGAVTTPTSPAFHERVIEDVARGNGIALRVVEPDEAVAHFRVVAMTGAEFVAWVGSHEAPDPIR